MKKLYILLVCLCLVMAALLVVLLVSQVGSREKEQIDFEALLDQLKVYQTPGQTETQSGEASDSEQTHSPASESREPPVTESAAAPSESEKTPVQSAAEESTAAQATAAASATEEPKRPREPEALLDFTSMHKTNPDICAWIEIEGTKVDYPVLQSPNDDDKYLTTAVDGSYYIGGSLFTQASYNSRDFNDPVTVIYGHTMRSGTLFGQLQSTYSASESFSSHSEIKLHLPGELRYYKVFAALPYSNMHILDAYDFSKEYWFNNFLDGVFDTRAFGAQFDREISPEYGDRVLILSTCLNEDSTKRFLVLAVYEEDLK